MPANAQALKELRNRQCGDTSSAGWPGIVRKEDIVSWAEFSGKTITEVLDEAGLELARGYAAKVLDWEFCDWAANDLFGALNDLSDHRIANSDEAIEHPELFWQFYLAFDSSETGPIAERDAAAMAAILNMLSQQQGGLSLDANQPEN